MRWKELIMKLMNIKANKKAIAKRLQIWEALFESLTWWSLLLLKQATYAYNPCNIITLTLASITEQLTPKMAWPSLCSPCKMILRCSKADLHAKKTSISSELMPPYRLYSCPMEHQNPSDVHPSDASDLQQQRPAAAVHSNRQRFTV